MLDKRPEADRILVAELHGTVMHHARWRELTPAEHAAAVAELRELAAGARRFAEAAGVLEGASEGKLSEPLDHQAAQLCRDAGADREAIGAWIEEGRRRRDAARMPLPDGGMRGGGAIPWRL